MQEIGSSIVSGLMLVGGAVLSVVGGGAGVPMMIGGAGSMVGSMASLEAQRNQIISYGQTGTSSSVEGLYGLQKFVWRITEPNLETSLYSSNKW